MHCNVTRNLFKGVYLIILIQEMFGRHIGRCLCFFTLKRTVHTYTQGRIFYVSSRSIEPFKKLFVLLDAWRTLQFVVICNLSPRSDTLHFYNQGN